MPTTRSKGLVPYIDLPAPRRSARTTASIPQHPPKTVPKKVKRKALATTAPRKTAPRTASATEAGEAEGAGGTNADGEEDGGSEDDEDSSSEVERMLTSPGKAEGGKGKAPERTVRRDTTAVPETENEGEGAAFQELHRSQRAARTYGKKGVTAKGKEKAVEPVEEPQGVDEDEEDQLDSDDVAPPAAQKENVPLATANSSKRGASVSQKKRKPLPKKRVAPRRSEPPQTPPLTDPDYSPSERAAFDGLSDSDAGDEGEEMEQGFSHPPQIFQQRSVEGWRPDRIWLHHEWNKEGKRDKVVKYIKDHGGRVVKKMHNADLAILPPYEADCYAQLYSDTLRCDAVPITCLWLKDCSERSYADDRPTRLEPLKYVASAPIKRDSRSRRYRRLNDVEKDKMAEFYALLQAGKMGRRELSERMERLLYDQTGRTRSEYSALLDEYEHQIKGLAKRLPHQRGTSMGDGQLFNDDATDSDASAPHAQPPRKRRRTSPATGNGDPAPDYTTQHTQLSLAYKRPLPLVEAISLSCSLSIARTETVLAALKEWEMATMGLPVEEAIAGEAADRLLQEVGAICWGPRTDRDIVKGKKSAEEIAERCGKTVEEVEDRRNFLEALGEDDRLGWYPNEAGLKRVLEERLDDESDGGEEQSGAEEGEEEELFPLVVPGATSA
ncbi:Proteophosphoglycan 5 [Rhodotorula toruloides ATCC 204091]|uniref:Proteophosphoglycan 5 n=2 Tax=Rhodotorula toruloides TaxID=5286 RepID=A0A2T0A719_RHOTO|nr:Proteophosphoglycan 5 [Rhodotorula toruloides ATCC 204091]KAK4332862.1 Proteophosphoglycan 5 [Rhodotorula toruloides]PRQ73797.1 Proteophosphoglycan 5 [Rhodotorula toruloides]